MLSTLLAFLLLQTVSPHYDAYAALATREAAGKSLQTSVMGPTVESAPGPEKITDSIGPVIDAPSVFSIDLKSGLPLYSKDIFARRSIASITKLVAAMVVLDGHSLDEVVTVSASAARQDGSKIYLKAGEKMTVSSLLTAVLVASGNDAVVALAEFDAGSETAFVEKMNLKIRSLRLVSTHFSNAKGFDESSNYSTAFDTIYFSRAALGYPFIRNAVSIAETTVYSFDGSMKHVLKSTDDLLEDPFFKVKGVKTGTTPLAGETFVSLFEISPGQEVLSVILGSANRFQETKVLLDWIKRNYRFPPSTPNP